MSNAAYMRRYNATQKGSEYNRLHARRWRLKSVYGLSLEEHEAMVQSQEGKCAICGELPNIELRPTSQPRLCIDHDHKTGKIRGLLCSTCNSALHKLERHMDWADKAKEYLTRFR